MGIEVIDAEKMAMAIGADAGEPIPNLRQALAEAKAELGRVTTPEQIIVRLPSSMRTLRSLQENPHRAPELPMLTTELLMTIQHGHN